MTIFNIQGKTLYNLSKTLNSGNSLKIDFSEYKTGIYILKIETTTASFVTKVYRK